MEFPPPIGATITVKHNGAFSTGTLKNPVYWREGPTTWQYDFKVYYNTLQLINQAPNWSKLSSHKKFFEKLAQHAKISQPTDWYIVKKGDVYAMGGKKL